MKWKELSTFKKCLAISLPIIYLGLFIVLYFTCGRELLEIVKDKEQFAVWLSSFGFFDEAVFVGIRAFQTVIKIIPAEPLEIGAGYAYGTVKGMLLCMLGTEIGSAIILILTSIFGVKIINLFFDVDKINQWSFISDSKKKYALLTVIYLIPGTPKDFITYFIGVTKTKILPFLLLTGVARIPSIISSTWCGEILGVSNIKNFVLAFALITIISLLATGIFADYLKARKEGLNYKEYALSNARAKIDAITTFFMNIKTDNKKALKKGSNICYNKS